MIHLFKSTTTKEELIQYNGDYILDNVTTKAVVKEEMNGNYTLDLTILLSDKIDNKAYDLLTEGSLIKIDEEYGEEYFRIAQVKKNRTSISVFARHITISDILTMWLEDVRPVMKNGNSAINYIFNNATTPNIFTVSSDITGLWTAYYQNKNVYEALFTADNSFIDRWGGEVYRRGFTIQINSKVGSDKGVSIRSKKNLTGLEISTNVNELTTRIYPKGFDGITINEKYVDSPLIGSYANIYSREVEFDDIRVNDEDYKDGYETLEEAQNEMKRRCKAMYEIDKVDTINATYRVDFVQLEKTEEYKNYSILEKTWLGDTVNVFDDVLNIDISVRVIGREYDCLKQERTKTELSNKDTKETPPTIKDILGQLGKLDSEINKIPSSEYILQQAKEQATAIINSGIKDSYVVLRQNELLIMDTKDINTATKVWRFNNGGLGFSSTGYYGKYGIAMTNDGKIVADFITTGVLNASLVKAGILSSVNGNFQINMTTGEFIITSDKGVNGFKLDSEGVSVFKNKIRTILLNDGLIKLYNSTTGAYMGYYGTVGSDLRVQLEGASTFSVRGGSVNTKMLDLDFNNGAVYGNSTMRLCGDMLLEHRTYPNATGRNGLILGNDDRADTYGHHNMFIACWNSLGFVDNNGLTNMFFDVRNGRIVMKGSLYQNTSTPPNAYTLANTEDEGYFSGYTKQDMIDSILSLETAINVDSDEDYKMTILPTDNDLVTTVFSDSRHIDHSSVISGLIEVVKAQQEQIEELKKHLNL